MTVQNSLTEQIHKMKEKEKGIKPYHARKLPKHNEKISGTQRNREYIKKSVSNQLNERS